MKHIKTAILLTLVFVVLTGFAFPVLIYGIGQVAFKHQADGSLIKDASGKIIGSELIGQSFSDPKYFHSRPSAAGSGYDASNSGGTNLGPTSDKLVNGTHKKLPDGKDDPGNFDGYKDLAAAYRKENGLADDAWIPADAATRSASGLDPDISPENASMQAARVAKARGMSVEDVKRLIDDNTGEPFLAIYGDKHVNVLKLNIALEKVGH
jgi:K+-transporting ATPase ATPase C chain